MIIATVVDNTLLAVYHHQFKTTFLCRKMSYLISLECEFLILSDTHVRKFLFKSIRPCQPLLPTIKTKKTGHNSTRALKYQSGMRGPNPSTPWCGGGVTRRRKNKTKKSHFPNEAQIEWASSIVFSFQLRGKRKSSEGGGWQSIPKRGEREKKKIFGRKWSFNDWGKERTKSMELEYFSVHPFHASLSIAKKGNRQP